MERKTNAVWKHKNWLHKKTDTVSNPEIICLQINSPCQNKAATKNECIVKTRYDCKNWNLKMEAANSVNQQAGLNNKTTLPYCMK